LLPHLLPGRSMHRADTPETIETSEAIKEPGNRRADLLQVASSAAELRIILPNSHPPPRQNPRA
jgi:hypothetical protein